MHKEVHAPVDRQLAGLRNAYSCMIHLLIRFRCLVSGFGKGIICGLHCVLSGVSSPILTIALVFNSKSRRDVLLAMTFLVHANRNHLIIWQSRLPVHHDDISVMHGDEIIDKISFRD
jgi:hypothetical protein